MVNDMMNITRMLVNEIRGYLERGASPLDIARSMGTNIDTIVFIINNYLT